MAQFGKLSKILLVLILLQGIHAFGQTGILFSAGEEISKEISKNKKAKLASRFTVTVWIHGDSIKVMRVPAEKVKGPARAYILSVQQELEKAYINYRLDKHIDLGDYDNAIKMIPILDKFWDITAYEGEAQTYISYEKSLKEAERIAEKRRKEKEKHFLDSINLVQERIEDSLRLEERTRGYHFVNIEHLPLKEKPTESSSTVANLGGTTYVKVVEYADNGYVRIQVNIYDGYVPEKYLVDNLSKIDYLGADIQLARKHKITAVTPVQQSIVRENVDTKVQAPYKSSTKHTSTTKSGSYKTGRQYYTGPRGGCYYINSSGNKTYVDRSFCR